MPRSCVSLVRPKRRGSLAVTVDGDTYPDISEIKIEISPAVEDPQITITDHGDGYYTISVTDSKDNPLGGANLYVTLSGVQEEPVTITGIKVDGVTATESNGSWSVTLPYGSTYPNPDSDEDRDRFDVTLSDFSISGSYVVIKNEPGVENPTGKYIITVVGTDIEANLTVTIAKPTTPPPTTVAVSSVTLDKTALGLTEGETAKLTATVNPANATNKTVTWTTSDAAVATVAADGTVTAVAAGTVTITAIGGGKTATCTVTVTAKEDPGTEPEEPKVETTPVTKVETGDNAPPCPPPSPRTRPRIWSSRPQKRTPTSWSSSPLSPMTLTIWTTTSGTRRPWPGS